MSTTAEFLADLQDQARAAETAENAHRAEAARRSEVLGRARAYAYRRANILNLIATALNGAPTQADACACATAALRDRLGWHEESPARAEVLEHFAPVSAALWTDGREDKSDTAADALAAFEAWYEASRQSSFWYLFEHYMPETPRVDF